MKQNLSLLFVNQSLSMGGAEVFDRDLLILLKQQGFQIQVITNSIPFAQVLEKEKIKVVHQPIVIDMVGDWKGLLKAVFLWPFFVFRYGMFLFKNRHSIDGVLMSGFPEKILVTPLAKWLSLPVIWFEFGPMDELFKKFKGLPKILYDQVTPLVDQVIVPSQKTTKSLLATTNFHVSKIAFIPCGRMIHLQSYRRVTKDKVPTLVCVSRLEPGKGQDLLLQAFAKVHQHYPQVQLKIVGQGDFLPHLRHLAHSLKLDPVVHFQDWVKDPLVEMRKAQIVVFPSMWELEGFGLAVIEAMAMQRPVVAFNRAPTNEIIVHNRTGLLATPGDVEDLASKIIQLLEDTVLQKELAQAAVSTFEKQYQLSKLLPDYIMLFKKYFT